MSRHEANKLLIKLTNAVSPAKKEERLAHYRLPELDTAPYRKRGAWPGRSFMLIGNSFNAECKISGAQSALKRTASLAIMFDQARETRRCLYVVDALQNESFVEVLSRFERDWLSRLPSGTVLGPAYGSGGQLIAQAFAVWSAIETPAAGKEIAVLAGVR